MADTAPPPDRGRVRAATTADADAIADVHVRSWQDAYRSHLPDDYLDALSVTARSRVWRRLLSHSGLPRRGALVLEDGAAIVGFAHISPSRDADATASTGELTAVYLAPEAWGRGGGRLLVDTALSNLRAAGSTTVTAWVLETNTPARRFYEALAWKHDGATKTDDRETFVLVEIRYRREI